MLVIQLKCQFIIIESMAEGHLLKSSGRVECQGQQMYYELLLSGTQYLLRFYDVLGKVRVIRPIKLPTESVEIYGIGEYLLCYETRQGDNMSGSIYIVKLSNLRSMIQKFNFDLQCHQGEQRKIKHLFCSIENGIIIFSDIQDNIYALRVNENDFTCKFLHKYHRPIDGLGINSDKENNQIVVISKKTCITLLEIEWLELDLIRTKQQPNLVNYYRGNDYIIHYAKYREWRAHQQEMEQGMVGENYFVHINKQNELSQFGQEGYMDKFTYQFSRDSELLFQSGKNYVIVFNRSQSIIVSIFDDLQRITQVNDNLMAELEENNYLINFKTDEAFNVMLEIRIFGRIAEKCTLYQYEISKRGNNSHEIFLKKNLHIIFQFNGLIAPIYERQVQKELNNFLNSKLEYKNSKQSVISQGSNKEREQIVADINHYGLGVELLKVSLQYFPANLEKFIRKLKCNVQLNKNICYLEETHRFFEYCQFILEENMDSLLGIAESIEKHSHENSCLKSKDKDELERIKIILENMINFLFSFINTLKIEFNETYKENKANQFYRKQQERMKHNEEVFNSARTFFLIAKMLEDEEIADKHEQRFRKLQIQREEINNKWRLNNTLHKLNYEPLFIHEHFSMITLLTKQHRPTFLQLIKFLIANRVNFVENAYFYQSITRIQSTPYLESDTGDLIENISFHLPLFKKENYELALKSDRGTNKALLYKMTGAVLKLKLFPFIKYMIQLNVFYKEYSLAIMLIFSQCFKVPGEYEVTDSMKLEHLFAVKSLIIANRIDLAHMYVLDHYSPEMFEEFAKLAQINGNIPEVLQLNEKGYILSRDQAKLKELLRIEDKKWSILFNSKYSMQVKSTGST